jgi:hypothetical protein
LVLVVQVVTLAQEIAEQILCLVLSPQSVVVGADTNKEAAQKVALLVVLVAALVIPVQVVGPLVQAQQGKDTLEDLGRSMCPLLMVAVAVAARVLLGLLVIQRKAAMVVLGFNHPLMELQPIALAAEAAEHTPLEH